DQLGERQLGPLVEPRRERPLGEQVHGHRDRSEYQSAEDPEHQGQLPSQSQLTVTPRAEHHPPSTPSPVMNEAGRPACSPSTYPAPRTVRIRRRSPSPSSLRRRYPTYTSTTLLPPVYSGHTFSSISKRLKTLPGLRAKSSRSSNSLAESSMRLPSRNTSRPSR